MSLRTEMISRICVLFLLVTYVQTEERISCPQSLNTTIFNVKCPATKKDWEERTKLHNCEQYRQNCTSAENYKYHCVLNAKGDSTVELCAPVVDIIGGLCTEFTVGGQFLQEHAEKKCKSCPFKYISANVYMYGECFNVKDKTETKNSHTEKIKKNNVFISSNTNAEEIIVTVSSSRELNRKSKSDACGSRRNNTYTRRGHSTIYIGFLIVVLVTLLLFVLVGYKSRKKFGPKKNVQDIETPEKQKLNSNIGNEVSV